MRRTVKKKCFFQKKTVSLALVSLLMIWLFTGCSESVDDPSLENIAGESASVSESVPISEETSAPADTESAVVQTTDTSTAPAETESTSAEQTTEAVTQTESAVSTFVTAESCKHNYSRKILNYSTCVQEGRARYTCTICGYSEEKNEYIEGSDSYHSFESQKVAPTCFYYGYTLYTCKNCSYSETKVDHSIEPSHKYEEKIISKPTQTSVGTKENVCRVCGERDEIKYTNYFGDTEYRSEKLAEADLAAMNLVISLQLNSGGKSDLEKLCILKEWYCNNTHYDSTFSKYTAYDSLVDHTSVCQGYAEALCLVLPKCGIETYFCSSSQLNHAWNLVKINGEWTYTDFTGGLNSNSDYLIIGSNAIGRANDTVIEKYSAATGWSDAVDFNQSQISTKIRIFEFDTTELEVTEEPGFLVFQRGNVIWRLYYKN